MKELERHIAQKKENKAKVGCRHLPLKASSCAALRPFSVYSVAWTAALQGPDGTLVLPV